MSNVFKGGQGVCNRWEPSQELLPTHDCEKHDKVDILQSVFNKVYIFMVVVTVRWKEAGKHNSAAVLHFWPHQDAWPVLVAWKTVRS